MDAQTEFAREIEQFLSDTGMSPTRFGKRAVGDPAFVFKIRKGRDVTLGTAEKVRLFMRTEIGAANERRAS